jgi:excisionase family DNA binding protein
MTFLTRKEAAQRLRIGLRTLDRRLASGEIKCFRLGAGPKAPVRLSEEQLQEYLNDVSRKVSSRDIQIAVQILETPQSTVGLATK